MTENEARERAAGFAPDSFDKLHLYADRLVAENGHQNLIARTTEATIWSRHLLDALQLMRFARPADQSWLDIGSGPGLPGLVLAIAGPWQVTLVEPRRRRAEFLERMIGELGLPNVTLLATTGDKVTGRYDLVSARAVASVDVVFGMTRGCTDQATRFALPKGRSAWDDVDAAKRRWHGLFHVEQSLTDPQSGIVVADRVSRR